MQHESKGEQQNFLNAIFRKWHISDEALSAISY